MFEVRSLSLPPVRERKLRTYSWGEPSAGLAMRVGVHTRVEQGAPFLTAIGFSRQGQDLPPGVTRMETRDADDHLSLRLTPIRRELQGGTDPNTLRWVWVRAGDDVVIRRDGRMPGVPEPGEPKPNLDGELPSIRVRFPIGRVRGALPPGRYWGVIELAVPGPKTRRPLYEKGNDRFWHGTLRSSRFTLEIVAESKR